MKRLMFIVVLLCFQTVPASASKWNLDPYFITGASVMKTEIGGESSTTPGGYLGVGSALNWISPNLHTEFRFGFGGQNTVFNANITTYVSYLLKPSFEIGRQWEIYGLLGVSSLSVDIADSSSSGTDLSYGLGFTYHVPNESISIEGEWMQYYTSSNTSTTTIKGMDISGGSINLVFEYY